MIYERKVGDDGMRLGHVLCQQSVMGVILSIYLVWREDRKDRFYAMFILKLVFHYKG